MADEPVENDGPNTDEPVEADAPTTGKPVEDHGPKTGILGWAARNSRAITALSAASIPIVLALIGYATNRTINEQNLDKEYVNLAITILGDDIGNEKCSTELAKEVNNDDAPITDENIEKLVGANGQRALRKYALELLTGASPFGVNLDKRQYVALLCGQATVVDPTAAAEPGVATGSGTGDANEEMNSEADDNLIETDAQLFNSSSDVTGVPPPSEECTIDVTASAGQITNEGAVDKRRLPPGRYRAITIRAESEDETDDSAEPVTTEKASAPPETVFAQLENGNWVKIREGSADFAIRDDCIEP